MMRETQKARLWAVLAVLLAVAAGEPINAGVVVDWGHYVNGDFVGVNYVTSTQSLQPGVNPPPNGDDSYEDPHVLSVNSTAPNTNYFGRLNFNDTYNPSNVDYSKPESTFYGGHVVVAEPKNGQGNTLDGMSNLWIVDGTQGDYLEVDVNPSVSLKKFAMLTYWTTPTDKTYKLDVDSVFTLKSTQDAAGKPDGHTLRWVVRDGEKFYVSRGIDFRNNTFYTNYNSSDPLQNLLINTNWYTFNPTEYDPIIDPPNPPSPTIEKKYFESLLFNSGDYAPETLFQNITAVGFYVQYTPMGSGANEVHYKIEGFNVTLDPNGNAVPEPSTFLLGLAGFGGVALKRWRKRRECSGTDAPLLTEATT